MSGPLAIAHTEASLEWGGPQIRTLTEAAGLIGRGHQVLIYAPQDARILAEAPRFGVPAVAMQIGEKQPPGVGALVGAFRANPVDIVNGHSSTDTWLAALACRWLRVRDRPYPALVRTRHVSIPVPQNRATRWLYQRAAARIVTSGELLRQQLMRENGIDASKIDSVPTGVDPATFAPRDRAAARAELNLSQSAPLVGIIGALRSWKGHRVLLDAMTQLRRAEVRLVIVGEGPQRAPLEAQVDALGLRARVLFAGQQRDVTPWLAACDACALPSYANEGLPQVLVQAMFAGVPCVTTDVGGIPEIARDGETALVVPREDAPALAAALDRLLLVPSVGAALAKRARAYALPRFGLATMLDRMEAVFERARSDVRRGAK